MSNATEITLPTGWARTTLGEIVEPTRPKVEPQKHPNSPYIGLEHIEPHRMRLLGTVPASSMKSSAVRFYARDVLYGRLRPYLNKVYCPDFDGVCSPEFIVLPEGESVDSKYLQYLLNSASFVSYASHLNAGDRPRVDFAQLSEYELSLAPLNEQHRIVAEIEKQFARLDECTVAVRRIAEDLKLYRASVLKAACEGRLVPTEAELARAEGRDYEPAAALLERILAERRAHWEADQLARMKAQGKTPKDDKWKEKYEEPEEPATGQLPELPEGWIWSSAAQITTRITDGEHITPQRSESGVLLLSARNIQDGKLSLEQVDYVPEDVYEIISQRLTIEPGDVLLSCSGSVGRSCIAPKNLQFALVRSVAVLKPVFEMGTFISLSIRSPLLQAQISEKQTQTAQANIFQGKIKTLGFALPPLGEQHHIVAEVERRLRIVDELEELVTVNIERADELRRSILKRAFEGRLVSQDPNDEPASVLLERIAAERQHRAEEAMTHKKSPAGRRRKKTRPDETPLFDESEPTRQTKELLAAFAAADGRLTVEEVFNRAGYSFRSDDEIDAFFEKLTEELTTARLKLDRTDEGDVFLERGAA